MPRWTSVVRILPLAAVAAAPTTAHIGVSQAQVEVMKGCHLEGWQFGLSNDAQGLARVELSPTLPLETVQCVYQYLSDLNVPLDRRAPVDVKARTTSSPR